MWVANGGDKTVDKCHGAWPPRARITGSVDTRTELHGFLRLDGLR